MATKKKPTTALATSMAPPNMGPHRPSNARMVQNFHLVWLDGSIDEMNNEDRHNSITQLRQVVNTVNIFIDVDECIDFVTDIKNEETFMLVSGTFSQIIVPIIQDMSQIRSVYIFCEDKAWYEQWAQEWPKVKGVYTDITPICEALKKTTQDCDHNSVSVSFVKMADGASIQNLNQLHQSFMYTQILKEILLTIDFEQEHMNEFLTYCREQFFSNTSEFKNVDKIEKEYHCHQPIWWYTYPCFLYSMLNKALRTMEVDLIIKMGFFLRDLHNHIATLHAEQYGEHHHSDSFIVYRGQGLSQTDFDQLMKTKDGLMSFNNFLSTSLDRAVSFAFAESNQNNPDLIGVLFNITINPSISSTFFANIHDVSAYQEEEEILFSMHSVFRIGQVEQINGNNRLWQVDLTLTADNDPQLHALTARMREETSSGYKGWHRLGKLMLKLDQFNKAEELYEILFKQTSNEGEKGHLFHQLASIKNDQGKYEEAIGYYEKSLEINRKLFSANHPDLATSYDHIGNAYHNMGEYSKAISYYEKALEIFQKTLPENHSDLATSYNNIGLVCDKMGKYSKAFSYYEKTLEILKKTLPANHPHLGTSYDNIGLVYNNMGEYMKALSSHEKSLEIYQKSLLSNHPDLATSYNNIGLVYYNMGEYSKALSYYGKALKIRQKALPANHPSLATSYNNIGLVYDKMGEYSKALSYYGRALEIRQKLLSANHPDFAQSYNNIGGVYDHMGEYSKALSYYDKALEIYQNTIPAHHPLLAIPFNNIGNVYYYIGEYSKALSYYEGALNIWQCSLPSNHPTIKNVRESIKIVKKKL
jgi:tetratricopeptide (TPR) repeat protein